MATDHVIESFRNELWPGYKTGEGIEPALLAQFHPLEEALAAMGVAVWPMIELEADDALASAARIAAADERVEKIAIWTPDKDLAQCVRGDRVVQIDRRSKKIRDAAGVREKFGVAPALIPDYLALVGDAADGYPGHCRDRRGHGGAAVETARRIEDFPGGCSASAGRCAALQGPRDAADRRTALRGRRRAAVARTGARLRGAGGEAGGAAPVGAFPEDRSVDRGSAARGRLSHRIPPQDPVHPAPLRSAARRRRFTQTRSVTIALSRSGAVLICFRSMKNFTCVSRLARKSSRVISCFTVFAS